MKLRISSETDGSPPLDCERLDQLYRQSKVIRLSYLFETVGLEKVLYVGLSAHVGQCDNSNWSSQKDEVKLLNVSVIEFYVAKWGDTRTTLNE
ncbi:hypothetical protein OUZ56_006871 [Daphnia magna]|uniref:Uncharacterized protein n=1 Tax=Daphnia magna TaxID=35525 RepID=A0ABQ9YXI1_9CRUS|nr:hypothetical protein OUZ56_006871 [Daphnia magna]